MSASKPTYKEMSIRLKHAEELIEAIKGSEIDAIIRQDDVAFVRNRLADEQIRNLKDELESRVTERTALLRSLAVKLIQAEQRERKRLAQLLHDHIQQLIAAAKMRLGAVRFDLPISGRTKHLDAIEELLKQAIDASRSLSVELNPPSLFSSGLLPAMTWLANNMNEIHGLKVSIDCKDRVEPECENIRILIFQAVRELLFNVVKHAATQEAWILVTHDSPDNIRVKVWDNGRGFGPNAQSISGGTGLGLFGIRERIEAMGGRFTIENMSDKGVRIDIIAPLHSKNHRKTN